MISRFPNRLLILIINGLAALLLLLFAITIVNGANTTAAPYARDLTGDYLIEPLLTVGEEVPLLIGDFGNYTTAPTMTFAMAGVPDGIGVYSTTEAFYVFLNHEFTAGTVSKLTISSTDQIRGARVSLFQFDKEWQVVGGRNLIEEVDAGGVRYTLDLSSGYYTHATEQDVLERFCSGYLAPTGFYDENDNLVPAWFAPEESDSSGRGFIVTPDGVAKRLDGLGLYKKEQIVAANRYTPADPATDQTVLISTEDTGNGEIYMYVGEQTAQDLNGFDSGQLYVLRVEDNLGNVFAGETMTEGQTFVGAWTAITDTSVISSVAALSSWVDANERSTNFLRLEDIHEDPGNPGSFYFATTGGGGLGGENYYGKLYNFVLQYPDPTVPMPFELVLTGGYTTGVSYDNLVVDSGGRVLLQEDRAAGGGSVMADQMRYARIWAYDIASDAAEPWFELEQATIDPGSAGNYGAWESSGIVEIGYDAGSNASTYLFDVQAHTINVPNYSRGGQLLLATPNSVPTATTLTAQSTASGPSVLPIIVLLVAATLNLLLLSSRRLPPRRHRDSAIR